MITVPYWELEFIGVLLVFGLVYWQAGKLLMWALMLISTEVTYGPWVQVVNNQPKESKMPPEDPIRVEQRNLGAQREASPQLRAKWREEERKEAQARTIYRGLMILAAAVVIAILALGVNF